MDDRDRRRRADSADDDGSEADDRGFEESGGDGLCEGNGGADDGRTDEVRTDDDVTDGDGFEAGGEGFEAGRLGSAEGPLATRGDDPAERSVWERFWNAEDGPLVFLREFAISVAIVLAIGLLLFGLSGVWPPMVAVESASMEPNINQYDLVFVTEPGRFASSEADDRGIATVERAEPTDYSTFNRAGNVIVYYEPGSVGPPIIHRAHLFVEAGENWYDRANPAYINADSCAALANCPAPYAGYITKGDNEDSNQRYDQANGIAPVVEPDWVTGVARLRVPYLGWIRLAVTGVASVGPTIPATAGGIAGVGGLSYAVGRRRHRRR